MKDSIQSNSASSAEAVGVTPMVERVARAMWAQRQRVGRKYDIELPNYDEDVPGAREEICNEARAAIEAMEPDAELADRLHNLMLRPGFQSRDDQQLIYEAVTALRSFAAALKEPAGGVG